MIKKASELTSTTTKIRILIAGYPGVGKSTTALSAPRPLIIDTDSIMRVSAKHRVDGVIQPSTYEELLDDLNGNDLSEYETIIFDTGMSLFNLMKYHVIKTDAKNGKRDGSLSLQGYGAIGREFQHMDEERTGWRNPLYMPRAAARIFLRVTNVRVERLQSILCGDKFETKG